ncbi:MAG: 30S ribosomal protein S20 [Candidatus Brocadiia bacterium]
MAHTLSARKRVRQSLKKSARNKSLKTHIKTQMKKLRLLVSQKGEAALIKTEFKTLTRLVDKAAGSGVIHRNKASRLKSRLSSAIAKKS